MQDNRPILVVAAHPDDEILGCGGTMACYRASGREVYHVILGEGVTSRYKIRSEADPITVNLLHAASSEAAKILGVNNVMHYDLPDNRFDTVPLLDIVKIVEECICRISPEIIFTHHGGDLNIDHCITQRAVLTASRPMAGKTVKEVLSFEIPSSTEWSFQSIGHPFRPNVFIDISDTIDVKIRSLSIYESEMRLFPHPRSIEAIKIRAQHWGTFAGYGAAEAYEMIRSLR